MQRRGIILVCFLFVAWSFESRAAEDWLPITSSSPNIAFFVDKSSIERKGEWVQFSERMVYEKPAVKDEGSGTMIKEKRVQRLMHCRDRVQMVAYGALYGENGSFITSTSFDEGHRAKVEIPPDTIAEAEFNMLCPRPAGTFFGVEF